MAEGFTGQDWVGSIYVAYWGRVPDPEGFDYWADQWGEEDDAGRTKDAAWFSSNFALQPEAAAEYDYFAAYQQGEPISPEMMEDFVVQIYNNLFNRDPGDLEDDEGLDYWINQLETGAVDPGEFIAAVSHSALDAGGEDADTLKAKTDVALHVKDQIVDQGLEGDEAVEFARSPELREIIQATTPDNVEEQKEKGEEILEQELDPDPDNINVIETDPDDNAEDVKVDTDITVTFDEDIQLLENGWEHITLSGTALLEGEVSVEDDVLTITPDEDLASDTEKTVNIGTDAVAWEGDTDVTLAEAYDFSFTTVTEHVGFSIEVNEDDEKISFKSAKDETFTVTEIEDGDKIVANDNTDPVEADLDKDSDQYTLIVDTDQEMTITAALAESVAAITGDGKVVVKDLHENDEADLSQITPDGGLTLALRTGLDADEYGLDFTGELGDTEVILTGNDRLNVEDATLDDNTSFVLNETNDHPPLELYMTADQADERKVTGEGGVYVHELGEGEVDLSDIDEDVAKEAYILDDKVTLHEGTNLGHFPVNLAGNKLTLSAAQAHGQTITGVEGNVVVNTLGDSDDRDLASVTTKNVTLSMSEEDEADITGYTSLPVPHEDLIVDLDEDGTLTRTADQFEAVDEWENAENAEVVIGDGILELDEDADFDFALTASDDGSIKIVSDQDGATGNLAQFDDHEDGITQVSAANFQAFSFQGLEVELDGNGTPELSFNTAEGYTGYTGDRNDAYKTDAYLFSEEEGDTEWDTDSDEGAFDFEDTGFELDTDQAIGWEGDADLNVYEGMFFGTDGEAEYWLAAETGGFDGADSFGIIEMDTGKHWNPDAENDGNFEMGREKGLSAEEVSDFIGNGEEDELDLIGVGYWANQYVEAENG